MPRTARIYQADNADRRALRPRMTRMARIYQPDMPRTTRTTCGLQILAADATDGADLSSGQRGQTRTTAADDTDGADLPTRHAADNADHVRITDSRRGCHGRRGFIKRTTRTDAHYGRG